ncbi:aldehyde ferredoxin oxidoreductase family protein, partial [Planctomycetota bacterium]
SLTYLTLDDEGVSFRDATKLQGQDTFATEDYILEHSPPKAGAMVIGPAGENRVACACIKSDRWRSLGRGGMGAVLGSKNVKGISFAGSQKAELADEALLLEINKTVAKKAKESQAVDIYRKFGTPNQVRVTNLFKCFPTRYWQAGYSDHWKTLSADYMQDNFEVTGTACPTCFLRCTKKSTIKHGRHQGLELEGPEYETIYAIGGLNGLETLEEVAYLNVVCDRLGLDTMSAGNLSAFAVEAYERGKTDFPIAYNQPDRIAELFHKIAHRQGIGDVLAKGIKDAATQWDLEDLAIHVKGLEPAGFDPRVLKGMGLSYATSARGACHLRGTFYKAEISGEIDKDQIAGKAKLHIDYEDRAALFDSLILCRFFRDFYLWEDLSQIVLATTGLRLDKPQLELLANQITQQTRQFNTREGLDGSTDTLPKRFFTEKTKEGASMTEQELLAMVDEYNTIRNERSEKWRRHQQGSRIETIRPEQSKKKKNSTQPRGCFE